MSSSAALAIRTFAGSGPATLPLAHATSFSQDLWEPVIEHLRALGVSHPAVTWDFSGHGASRPLQVPVDWWQFGSDVLEVLDRAPAGPRIGIGHSMGGTALVMAELARPGAFRGFTLIEPVITRPPYGPRVSPMSDGAGRRRPGFDSRAHARAALSDRLPFSAWDADVFEAYVRGAFREVADGAVVLACAPATESAVYEAARAHGLWERVPEVRTPTRILISDDPGPIADDLRPLPGRFPVADTEPLPGTSHLAPMERPEQIAAAMARHLAALRLV